MAARPRPRRRGAGAAGDPEEDRRGPADREEERLLTRTAPAQRVVRAAPAKINLALHVTGRRPDGYHELDSLVVFADLGERVAVAPADDLSLALSGPFAAAVPEGAANLALRAAEALRRRARIGAGAAVAIDKRIPPGAGLGGGSADAAATLLALDALWACRLGPATLAAIGRDIGADVPMCLVSRPLRAGGIGERIATVEHLAPLPLLLVWPGRPVATAEVFRRLPRADNPPMPPVLPRLAGPAAAGAFLAVLRNDLEAPAIAAEPAVAAVLAALRADPLCLLARMTGSGSAVFGLYATADAAAAAAPRLRAARPGWWVEAVTSG